MSEMVERVARALYRDGHKRCLEPYLDCTRPDANGLPTWRTVTEEEYKKYEDVQWPHYADAARAAIKAIRDIPDGEIKMRMVSAGKGELLYEGGAEVMRAFHAMIDAALKDGGPR